MVEYRLTTIDNPFDPFTEFDQWILFDKEKGYDSSEYLARIVPEIPEDFSEEEKNEAISDAIDLILERDVLNLYKKVSRTVPN